MKTIVKTCLLSLFSCVILAGCDDTDVFLKKEEKPSAVFGGGPIYITPSTSLPELKKSGFGNSSTGQSMSMKMVT